MTTTYDEHEEFIIHPITGELLLRTGEYVSEWEQYIESEPVHEYIIGEPTEDELLYMTPFPPGEDEDPFHSELV